MPNRDSLLRRGDSRWSDDRHVLLASYFYEDGYLELEIEHPGGCEYRNCPLVRDAEFAGIGYALFGDPQEYLIEKPINHVNEVWQEMARRLLNDDDVRVPFGARWSGSYDYWGEWDEDLVVWPLEAAHA